MAGKDNKEPEPQPAESTKYITVSPFVRYFNHFLAGITESRQVAVRVNPATMDTEYEPTKIWLKRTATVSLLGLTAAII
ncbi:hypothetical protein IWW43_001090, partial [Coemansia sp. RSA 1935]